MGDATRLTQLLAAGASPLSMTDENNSSRVHVPVDMFCYACDAIDSNSPACLAALIFAGARLDGPPDTTLPLHYLLGVNQAPREAVDSMAACIALLIDAGADPNAAEVHGDTPMLLALYNLRGPARTSVIEALLSHGASFQREGGFEMDLALSKKESQSQSATAERESTVRLLIGHGARPRRIGGFHRFKAVEPLRGLLPLHPRAAIKLF